VGKLDLSPFLQFTLPSEAQWEYACRSGTTTAWYCGDSDTALKEHAWFHLDPDRKTRPVGELKPNGWGLYDLYGNAWEWCADRWATDYYAQSPVDDPSGPLAGSRRMFRGGFWTCRSASRNAYPAMGLHSLLGFRLASVLADE